MPRMYAVYAIIVAALVAGIAASVPWHRQPAPVIVAAAVPAPAPLPKPKPEIPVKAKPRRAAPKQAYSCADLKLAASVLTQAQIEAKGKEHGATPDQVRAAQRACQ